MNFQEEQTVCTICHDNQAKYTCPACGIKTCSLPCYKSHQEERECSGKVDSNRYLNREELAADPVHLNRDYNFLTRVDRQIEVAKEDITKSAKNVFKRTKFPHHHQANKRQRRNDEDTKDKRIAAVEKVFLNNPTTMVKRENTLVVQLPLGMSRSNSNKTGYDKKLNSFVWTIEWVVLDDKGEQVFKFVSYRLKEGLVLQDAVPMNIVNNKFPNEVDKTQLKFYLHNVILKEKLIKLDSKETLSAALKDKIVLEYPTIYIAANDENIKDRIADSNAVYGLDEDEDLSTDDSSSDDSSDDSSSDDDDDDESGSDSDSGPEEQSLKLPPLKTGLEDTIIRKPVIEVIESTEKEE
ncbi:Box C/D snoRNA protein 1 [Candida viswanathii]|uniref:Box C/D snoRNA protein 1 n=1 Tax=Candida viswanathii TaxID=5486 RepID=A0A367YLW9_9ASCO|nr:Box C/D snoRNA protein 1 [Candida viswanathii]